VAVVVVSMGAEAVAFAVATAVEGFVAATAVEAFAVGTVEAASAVATEVIEEVTEAGDMGAVTATEAVGGMGLAWG
jgi:thiamine monophosphate kinase